MNEREGPGREAENEGELVDDSTAGVSERTIGTGWCEGRGDHHGCARALYGVKLRDNSRSPVARVLLSRLMLQGQTADETQNYSQLAVCL